jgi:hypothetical protein
MTGLAVALNLARTDLVVAIRKTAAEGNPRWRLCRSLKRSPSG